MKKFDPARDIETLQYSGEHRGVNPSITDSSTFWFDSAETMAKTFEENTGNYLYTRHSSPSIVYLDKALAALEGTESANTTASGMGAISSSLLHFCKSGDHIVSSRTVYGGTYALMKNFLPTLKIETDFVDITKLDQVEKAIRPETKVLYCEAVSNPLLEIADIPALSKIAKKHDLKLIVDNTFSPYIMAPAQWGADVVIHSLTKYINGASDAIGGVICGSQELVDSLRDVNTGATMLLGPTMDNVRAASVLKNLKTLAIRIKQHSQNAMFIAEQMQKEGIRVIYPGLESHPSHELISEIGNMEFGYGGMLTIDAGSKEKAFALMEEMQNRKLGYLAVSLGFYNTLFSSPGTGTSSEIPAEERKIMGLTDSLIRFSIGLDNNIEESYKVIKDCMRKINIPKLASY